MKTELHPNVRDFLAQPIPHFIGGQPHAGATTKVTNPSDGSALAEVAAGGAAEIDLAVAAAAKAFSRVAERLVAGNSWINAHNVFAYGLPYGGVNSPETFNDYLRSQTIARPLA